MIPLTLAVARVGCLLAGCCYGRETTAWPALVLSDVHGFWASRYPTHVPRLFGPFTWTHLYCVIGIGVATALIVRGLLSAPETASALARNQPGQGAQ